MLNFIISVIECNKRIKHADLQCESGKPGAMSDSLLVIR